MKASALNLFSLRRFAVRRYQSFFTAKGVEPSAISPGAMKAFFEARVNTSEFLVRDAQDADFLGVQECGVGAIDSLDYLPAYYHRLLRQPNRKSAVIVHKPTNKIAHFCSMLVVDGGKTIIGSSGRTRVELRKRGLPIFGILYVSSKTHVQHPDCIQSLSITRLDILALLPRYLVGRQFNKLLGTNYLFNVASDVSEAENLPNKLSGADIDNISIASIPFTSTSRLLARNSKIAKVLVDGEHFLMDSFPYKMACDANFTQYPDLFNTKVHVSSATGDIRTLTDTHANPDQETLSAVDSLSFVNVNAAEAGLNVKIYVYTASVDAVLAHVRHGVLQSLPEIHKLHESRDTLAITKHPNRVHYTVVFPLKLNPRDVRKRLFDAGYAQSVTGTDIQRLYLMQDESMIEMWKEGFDQLSFFKIPN